MHLFLRWMYKWPMKSQKTGRRTKRFFVLRDNILSYHKTQPSSMEINDVGLSSGSLTLTANSTVGRGRYFFPLKYYVSFSLWLFNIHYFFKLFCGRASRYLFMPCLTVATPYDTLWAKVRGKIPEQEKWIHQIRLGIAQSSKRNKI